MIMPEISVVITTHNRCDLLVRAIDSVAHQTFLDFDVHIVDDGSSDDTPAIVESLIAGKENFHYWRHETAKGLAAARNTGVFRSSGRYIAFLDDDDEWKAESLARRFEGFSRDSDSDQNRIGVVYCGCEIHIVDEDRVTYNMPRIKGDIREHLLCSNLSTIPSSCLFSRKAMEDVGGFDEELCSSIDHDIWMSLAVKDYSAVVVSKPLTVTYHVKDRITMVSDVSPRIRGVEQFIGNWTPTYIKWFGERGGLNYARMYRVRVLGGLAGTKLSIGHFRETCQLIRHVVKMNRGYCVGQMSLLKTITLTALRESIPVKIKLVLRNVIGLFKQRGR